MSNKPPKRIKKRDKLDATPIGKTMASTRTEYMPKAQPHMIKPYTLKECFDILDRALSNEDKEYLIDQDRPDVSFHFGTGVFIRNKLVCGNDILIKNMTEQLKPAYGTASEDDISDYIISRYRVYLRMYL